VCGRELVCYPLLWQDWASLQRQVFRLQSTLARPWAMLTSHMGWRRRYLVDLPRGEVEV
jgi:hypothetical protein